jgi:hypothetical protein
MRTTDRQRVDRELYQGSKSVPALVPFLERLLDGEAIDHQAIIMENGGKQHRLGLAVLKLRVRYGFGDLIQCPRVKDHPLRYHYFIAPSDIGKAHEIALNNGLRGK